MKDATLPVDLEKIEEQDLPFVEKDLDLSHLSTDVRTVVGPWLHLLEHPETITDATMEESLLTQVLDQITKALQRRVKFNPTPGKLEEQVCGTAIDMTMLLQIRNFILPLLDLIRFADDLKHLKQQAGLPPRSLLFQESEAGYVPSVELMDKFREGGSLTDMYRRRLSPSPESNSSGHHLSCNLNYHHSRIMRLLGPLLPHSTERTLSLPVHADPLSDREIPKVQYIVKHSKGPINPYDLTFHQGTEDALRAVFEAIFRTNGRNVQRQLTLEGSNS